MLRKGKLLFRRLIFPGINLHARLRYGRLSPKLGASSGTACRLVLDAGSGNGMLSYQAYLRRNKVTAVTIHQAEADKAREYFHSYLGVDKDKCEFIVGNLYTIDLADESFDEIICTEVLEHLRKDDVVCRKFFKALKPGGVLHITSPNADHPYNKAFPLDLQESGGHVRVGYSLSDYSKLLEPIGFSIAETAPLGGPVRQFFNSRIKHVQQTSGPIAGIPLFLLSLPALAFESKKREAACPFCYYVKAVKPSAAGGKNLRQRHLDSMPHPA